MTALDNFPERINVALTKLHLDLTPLQVQQLQDYAQLLIKWNRTYNLTALRSPDQILIHHIFDSLALVNPIKKHLDTIGHQLNNTIVDVGSGGGLPGVVLAICLPESEIYCVDAVEKKTAFIRQVRGALKLSNLNACHGRIEQINTLNANVVVSRAFASLRDFVELSGKHLQLNGVVIAMKGVIPEQEIQELTLHTAWKVWHIETLEVPDLNAQRCLVWIRG